jgi:hypothetical protein
MANVNDVYRITMLGKMLQNGEPILNTFYYRISIAGAGDEKLALATAFQPGGAPYAALLGMLPTNYSCTLLAVQPVKPVGTVEYIAPTVTIGSIAGQWSPSQVAMIVTRRTATPGKKGRGRIFVGPVPISQIAAGDNDTVTAGYASSLNTPLVAAISNGGWTFVPVLWSRKFQISYDLTAGSGNVVLRTRRSRAEGVRFHRRRRRTVVSI